jgi:hypothetical protein
VDKKGKSKERDMSKTEKAALSLRWKEERVRVKRTFGRIEPGDLNDIGSFEVDSNATLFGKTIKGDRS